MGKFEFFFRVLLTSFEFRILKKFSRVPSFAIRILERSQLWHYYLPISARAASFRSFTHWFVYLTTSGSVSASVCDSAFFFFFFALLIAPPLAQQLLDPCCFCFMPLFCDRVNLPVSPAMDAWCRRCESDHPPPRKLPVSSRPLAHTHQPPTAVAVAWTFARAGL